MQENLADPVSAKDIWEEFPPALKEMLSNGMALGENRKVPFVGGSTLNNLYSLWGAFNKVRPLRTLEIGLACGASGLLLTSLHSKLNPNDHEQHTAIDPFQDHLDNAGFNQIRIERLDAHLRLIREKSHLVLPRLLKDGEKFQLIYVDGSHHFEDVFIDIFYGLKLLDKGGLIIIDDSTWPDVRKAIRFFTRNFAKIIERQDVLRFRPREGITFKTQLAIYLGRNQLTVFKLLAEPERHFSEKFLDF